MENQQKQLSTLTYLRTRVTPILQPLQYDILLNTPTNIYEYSYRWLKNDIKNKHKAQKVQTKFKNDSDEQRQDFQNCQQTCDQIHFEKMRKRKKSRKGISGQIYSMIKPKDFIKVYGDKCEDDRIKILINLRNSVLFRNISQKNIAKIIDCMEKKEFQPGEVVIKQGDIGSQLFLVASGMFKCQVQNNDDIYKIYEAGQIFGELSLLYGTSRTSTITALVTGNLFVLSRDNFNSILRDQVLKKTKLCQQTLSKNQLFSSMSQYDRSKITESLKQVNLPAGKYIIREGQIGDRFFIVCSGNLVAQKKIENGEVRSVYYYKEGDYFGEISLIRNVPRQASVKTLTTSKLLFIQRSAFKRLLGSSEYIMRLKQKKYRQLEQQNQQ